MKQEYKTDARGRQIPVEMIKDIDLLRDQTVKEIMRKTLCMRNELFAFKAVIWSDIEEFLSISAEQHGIEMGGKKGNITLTSYDGEYKIMIAVSDSLQFNEKLQVAKELIDSCIKRWSGDAKPELKVLVDDAFNVDKQGKINTARVLRLRRLKIEDAQWHEAMNAITESLMVSASKTYMRFYQRAKNGQYVQLPLDVTAL